MACLVQITLKHLFAYIYKFRTLLLLLLRAYYFQARDFSLDIDQDLHAPPMKSCRAARQ